MNNDDYVLGTQEAEIARLGLQHRLWRPRMLDGWRRCGIGPGRTVLDIGAGPGFAALELADAVGPGGRVIAFERSSNFLAHLAARSEAAGIRNIEARRRDVAADSLGIQGADAAWCRWVLSFVDDPANTVRNIADALKPGGIAIFHEYACYESWRTMPPDPDLERFRELVLRSWRDSGGEPNAACSLPGWLDAAGMEVQEIRPMIETIRATDPLWEWPAAFVESNAVRLHELGYASAAEAERFGTALRRPGAPAWMMTPLVAEVIAVRRAGRSPVTA